MLPMELVILFQKFKKNIMQYMHYMTEPSFDTVGTESIQTPLNFSLFVILQPFAKII